MPAAPYLNLPGGTGVYPAGHLNAGLAPTSYLSLHPSPDVPRAVQQGNTYSLTTPIKALGYGGTGTPGKTSVAQFGVKPWTTHFGPTSPPYTPTPSPLRTQTGTPLGAVPLTGQALTDWFTQQERSDPQFISGSQGQIDALKQLWERGVVMPFQSNLLQFGGTPGGSPEQDALRKQMEQFGVPQITDPTTGQKIDLGRSLFDHLDFSAAARNPYSTLNQIAHNQTLQNAQADAMLSRMGAQHSGVGAGLFGENAYQAGAQRYTEAANLLNTLGGNYGTFLGNLQQGVQNMGTLVNDAYGRVSQAIQQGFLAPPDVFPAGYGGGVPFVSGASSFQTNPRYYQSGKGKYGSKPVY